MTEAYGDDPDDLIEEFDADEVERRKEVIRAGNYLTLEEVISMTRRDKKRMGVLPDGITHINPNRAEPLTDFELRQTSVWIQDAASLLETLGYRAGGDIYDGLIEAGERVAFQLERQGQ
jgi:hypothetical protein